jgi:retron-type reverse transcriptase
MLLSMDRKEVTLLVLIDLSATFNTIDHAILLETLEKDFGVTGNALKWLTSYLSKRKQTILIKDHKSVVFNLRSGVPQGSCLGPVLFILYVAGLFKIIDKHLPNAHTYADDTQIYHLFRPDTSLSQDAALKSIETVLLTFVPGCFLTVS